MKKIVSIAFFVAIVTAIPFYNVNAQSVSLETMQQMESLLQRTTTASTGNGPQTVYIFCGTGCSRCTILASNIAKMPPEERAQFEFRWAFMPGGDIELMYPVEKGDVLEMFNTKQGKPLGDSEGIVIGATYNSAISGEMYRVLGKWPSMTPAIVTKKDGVIRAMSLEDMNGKIAETLAGSETIKAKSLVKDIKEVMETFKDSKPVMYFAKNKAYLRLLPSTDAPYVHIFEKGQHVQPIIENDAWIGIESTSIPFVFIAKEELEQR